MAASVSQ